MLEKHDHTNIESNKFSHFQPGPIMFPFWFNLDITVLQMSTTRPLTFLLPKYHKYLGLRVILTEIIFKVKIEQKIVVSCDRFSVWNKRDIFLKKVWNGLMSPNLFQVAKAFSLKDLRKGTYSNCFGIDWIMNSLQKLIISQIFIIIVRSKREQIKTHHDLGLFELNMICGFWRLTLSVWIDFTS